MARYRQDKIKAGMIVQLWGFGNKGGEFEVTKIPDFHARPSQLALEGHLIDCPENTFHASLRDIVAIISEPGLRHDPDFPERKEVNT